MRHTTANDGPFAAFHLLGTLDVAAALALQTRLVYEAGEREDGRIVVLLCEHPATITIGRAGSRQDIRIATSELRALQIDVQYVGRGGGCVLHQPGQLAVYPIVPLAQRGWNAGQYLERFKRGLAAGLRLLGVRARHTEAVPGVQGRTGLLAAVGVAVRGDVTLHGAWINVQPTLSFSRQIDTLPPAIHTQRSPRFMSSLLAESSAPVTMPSVRAALVSELAAAWDCPRHCVMAGHPLHRPAASAA